MKKKTECKKEERVKTKKTGREMMWGQKEWKYEAKRRERQRRNSH